jgi:hypothetical protein
MRSTSGGALVTTTRFYPKGYIGLEQGILLVAKIRNPERWLESDFLPGESAIWDGLGWVYNAEYLQNHLAVLVPKENRDADTGMIDRLCDYGDASVEVRKALYAGELTAEYIDENGQLGTIIREGWATEAGSEILSRGIADLADRWTSLVMVCQAKLELFARELSPAGMDVVPQKANPEPAKRIAEATIAKKFAEWRASRGRDIPTYPEDVAFMKQFGIGRNRVRKLREGVARLPRGKPAKKQ